MNCGVEHSLEWLESCRDKLLYAIQAAEGDNDLRRADMLRQECGRVQERIVALKESIQRDAY